MNEVVIVMGCPGCGKSTIAQEFTGYTRLNRDITSKTIDQLIPLLDKELIKKKSVVMDNTYPTRKSRQAVIDTAKKHQAIVRCIFLDATIEDAQYNVCQRMIERYGQILMPDDIATSDDPNMFPPAVLFKYRKELEMPELKEGFESVEKRPFVRRPQPKEFKHGAIIFDYDGTLRKTKSGEKYCIHPSDIEILPGRKEKLQELAKTTLLLGVSNQSVISKGNVTAAEIVACFEHTNKLLGVQIEYKFCPHNPAPIQCYCRKPMPGLAVEFIHRYKLDWKKTFFVGDMTSDKTFAQRSLIGFVNPEKFFAL